MKDCLNTPAIQTAVSTNAVHSIVSRVDIVSASRKATHGSSGTTNASVVTTEEEPPSSEAITSVFHSWSKNNDSDNEAIGVLSMDELQRRLKRRLSSEDFPNTPSLKRRKRPTCCFINYMTSSTPTMMMNSKSALGIPSTETAIIANAALPPLSFSSDSCLISNKKEQNYRLAISPTNSLDAEELSEEQLDLLASFDDDYFSADLGHATLWG